MGVDTGTSVLFFGILELNRVLRLPHFYLVISHILEHLHTTQVVVELAWEKNRWGLILFGVTGSDKALFSVSLGRAAGFSEGSNWLHAWQTLVAVVLSDYLLLDLEVV